MSRKKSSIPVPRLHKPSGRVRIYVNGSYLYLGPWGSAEADREYRRILAEMLTPGCSADGVTEFTVNDVVAAFLKWAKGNYRHPTGESTGTFEHYVIIVRPLVLLYGDSPVAKFGPLALKAVREDMTRTGLTRKTINRRIVQLRTIFKWGVENEMVPVTVHQALLTVRGLAEGKSAAKERPPVPQVELANVLKTLEHCHKTLADMIRVQLLAGMRPKEVRLMRSCDINRSDDIWVYIPHTHKTQHKGKHRPIPILPESQAILMPYLIDKEGRPEEYLFRPADAVFLINLEKRAKRKTKVQPSQRKRKKGRKFPFRECYSKDAYGSAVDRAAERAGVPHWSPNQLRHTALTAIRAKEGIEAAQVMANHKNIAVTEIYAEKDMNLIMRLARKYG